MAVYNKTSLRINNLTYNIALISPTTEKITLKMVGRRNAPTDVHVWNDGTSDITGLLQFSGHLGACRSHPIRCGKRWGWENVAGDEQISYWWRQRGARIECFSYKCAIHLTPIVCSWIHLEVTKVKCRKKFPTRGKVKYFHN